MIEDISEEHYKYISDIIMYGNRRVDLLEKVTSNARKRVDLTEDGLKTRVVMDMGVYKDLMGAYLGVDKQKEELNLAVVQALEEFGRGNTVKGIEVLKKSLEICKEDERQH